MSSSHRRLLDPTPIDDVTTAQPMSEAWDAGNYQQLNVHLRVLQTTNVTAGTLRLLHAAVNKDGAYIPLDDGSGGFVEIALGTEDYEFIQVDAFLRFLRWAPIGVTVTSNGKATAMVDIIAKD